MLPCKCTVPPPFPDGEPGFIQELKSYDPRRVHWNTAGEIPAGFLKLSGKWEINKSFPDPEKLLETAYDAIERFAAENVPAADDKLVIVSKKNSTLSEEEYSITISAAGVTLQAADTEGLRRAVYNFLDICRSAEIPALEYQQIIRKPWLKNRISRCFFGPIKRPPFFRDELTDDIDYYPEPYLDRLAAEGINGIWLTIVWREMAETPFLPADPLRQKRIEKLKKTVAKCRRYGIKVWVFCIEPASWTRAVPAPSADMGGDSKDAGNQPFCIASENSQKYITETVYSIFRDTPNLGGMMLISLGERPTSCLSCINEHGLDKQPCADKCGLSKSKILNTILCCIREGIRKAGSNAQVLSWLYNPKANQIPEWWFTLPEELDKEHILAFNFESGCSKVQDGRVCSGGDYWLSSIGPADRFGRIAAAAKGNCEVAAKLQVGCSHELATIPFMPVPGNLYEKYRAMKKLGVSSVIQCWYFGNYPGLMNRAAGMLAFAEFNDTQIDFLKRLAAVEWGNQYAPKLAEMWQNFGKAYSNYPLDIQFQYYGPMHDGIVWPLHLKQVMTSLPRSWKPDAEPAGDAVGECLNTFELANVVTLSRKLAEMWSNAVAVLPELRSKFADDPARLRECDLYEALELLFNSGARILSFYDMRAKLFDSPLGCHALLEEMHNIVKAEKSASARMIELCKSDARLGYHSEAEVFKFYPAKLEWRIAELEKLEPLFEQLASSSEQEVKNLLAWEGETLHTGIRYYGDTYSAECRIVGLDLEITMYVDPIADDCVHEQHFVMLMDSNGVKFPLEFPVEDGTPYGYNQKTLGIEVKSEGNGKEIIRIPLSKLDFAKEIFAGFHRTWSDAEGKQHHDPIPAGEYNYDARLNFCASFSAGRLRKLILEK